MNATRTFLHANPSVAVRAAAEITSTIEPASHPSRACIDRMWASLAVVQVCQKKTRGACLAVVEAEKNLPCPYYQGELFDIHCRPGTFGLVLTAASRPEHTRLLLYHCTHLLAPGGALVLGYDAATDAGLVMWGQVIARWYTLIRVITTDPHARNSRVLLAVRREKSIEPRTREVQQLAETLMQPEWACPEPRSITLPALPGEPAVEVSYLPFAQASRLCTTSGLWGEDGSIPGQAEPQAPIRPLMPLRKGHLALAVAGGLFGTITMPAENGRTVMVKGLAARQAVRETSSDGDKHITTVTDTWRTGCAVLVLPEGELTLLWTGQPDKQTRRGL